MSTESRSISVAGLRVEVVRKDIKNLHPGVYPPHGRVRVAAPLAVGDDAVRLAVIGRLGWIRSQRARFAAQPRQSARQMVGGEAHYYLGRRYRLRVVERDGPTRVELRGKTVLNLLTRADASAEERALVLRRWYRQQMTPLIPPLVATWERALDVAVAEGR